jgi:aminotransferase in exopolysaccharide biosynthesis
MNINKIVSFIREQYQTDDFIPLHEPSFVGNEKKYVNATIDSTFVSSVGKFVDKFEEMIADISLSDSAIAVVNGTSALQVALQISGVKPNHEVITQALTFVATANAISYNGAVPVFLDVDLDTMGLSPVAVNNFLQEYGDLREDGCYNKKTGRKISACLPMHTFGFPVHLNELVKICDEWSIPIIEDSAEALGSLYNQKPVGSFGKCGIYSFNGNKIVTAGGGGAIVTNDKALAKFAKHLTTTAKKPHPYEYIHDEVGYNYRMPNLNAALICAQLENLEYFISQKRKLADKYYDFFKDNGIKFRQENQNTKANYWLMCIEVENFKQRNLFLEETNALGIMTRPIWRLMHKLPMFEHCYHDRQQNAEYLESRIINIPSSVIKNV